MITLVVVCICRSITACAVACCLAAALRSRCVTNVHEELLLLLPLTQPFVLAVVVVAL
jgi:hypothetical protein